MAIQLQLNAQDVTLLPEERPVADSTAVPKRMFAIGRDNGAYSLAFDGQRATVLVDNMKDLLVRLGEGTPVEWRYSSDPTIQTTFRPLNRILQRITSTPSYQLFRAGFDIGDAIGLFDMEQVRDPAIADSFQYLVGILRGGFGKKGRLFFLPEGHIPGNVEMELIANSKIDSADLYVGEGRHIAHKVFVPYATPIGFNTKVSRDTEDAWRRISDLIRHQGGGPVT